MATVNIKNVLNQNSVSSSVDNIAVSTESLTVSGTSILDITNINDTCNISGVLNVDNTTDSTSVTTGAIICDGGAGIAKSLNVGNELKVNEVTIKTNTGTTDNFSIGIGNTNTLTNAGDVGALDNICIGNDSGQSITTGDRNIFIGSNSGNSFDNIDNIGIGDCSLNTNSVGVGCIAIGTNSLLNATTFANTAIGYEAGKAITSTSGGANTIVGYQAGLTTNGVRNVMIGKDAGTGYSTGDDCVFLGEGATSTTALNNVISIGRDATCDLANQCTIGNSSLTVIRPSGDDTCDLGETDKAFKNLYIGNVHCSAQPRLLKHNNATQTLTTGVSTTVLFQTSTQTGGSGNDPTYSTGTFTINEDGVYLINYTVGFEYNNTGARLAWIEHTGSTGRPGGIWTDTTSSNSRETVTNWSSETATSGAAD